jgi:hypothetical protein
MAGNRDFPAGPGRASACGMQSLADPTVLEMPDGAGCSATATPCAWPTPTTCASGNRCAPRWQPDFLSQPLADARPGPRAAPAKRGKKRQIGRPPELWADVDTEAARRLAAAPAGAPDPDPRPHPPPRRARSGTWTAACRAQRLGCQPATPAPRCCGWTHGLASPAMCRRPEPAAGDGSHSPCPACCNPGCPRRLAPAAR